MGSRMVTSYGFPPSARFGFSKYGRAQAHQLCREYCRRGEYFCQLWVESDCGDDEFEYRDEHVAGYVEDMEWLNFMIALPAESAAFARGMELWRLVIRVGPTPDVVP